MPLNFCLIHYISLILPLRFYPELPQVHICYVHHASFRWGVFDSNCVFSFLALFCHVCAFASRLLFAVVDRNHLWSDSAQLYQQLPLHCFIRINLPPVGSSAPQACGFLHQKTDGANFKVRKQSDSCSQWSF